MRTKQELIKKSTELVKDIKYYNQYPYYGWIGKWITKGILRGLKRRLERTDRELLSIINKEKQNRQK